MLISGTRDYRVFQYAGISCISCFMDASKAFDRVSHDTLFGIVKDRGLNFAATGILVQEFERQS